MYDDTNKLRFIETRGDVYEGTHMRGLADAKLRQIQFIIDETLSAVASRWQECYNEAALSSDTTWAAAQHYALAGLKEKVDEIVNR